MRKNTPTGLYLVAIVGIVAMFGLLFLVKGYGGASYVPVDLTGQAWTPYWDTYQDTATPTEEYRPRVAETATPTTEEYRPRVVETTNPTVDYDECMVVCQDAGAFEYNDGYVSPVSLSACDNYCGKEINIWDEASCDVAKSYIGGQLWSSAKKAASFELIGCDNYHPNWP